MTLPANLNVGDVSGAFRIIAVRDAAASVYDTVYEPDGGTGVALGDLSMPASTEAATTQDVSDAIAAIPPDTQRAFGTIAAPAVDEAVTTQDAATHLAAVTPDTVYDDNSVSLRPLAHRETAEELRKIRGVTTITREQATSGLLLWYDNPTKTGVRIALPAGTQRYLTELSLQFRATFADAGKLVQAEMWPINADHSDVSNRIAIVGTPAPVDGHLTIQDFTPATDIAIPNGLTAVDLVAVISMGGTFRYSAISYGTGLGPLLTVNATGVAGLAAPGIFAVGKATISSLSLKGLPAGHLPLDGFTGQILVKQSDLPEDWAWQDSQVAAPPPEALTPAYLVGVTDPGQPELGDLTFIPIDGVLPVAVHNVLIEVHSDVAPGTNFGGLVVGAGDLLRAIRDTAGGIAADWVKFRVQGSDVWPLHTAADGVLRASERRLAPELQTLPDSTSVPPPVDGLTFIFSTHDGLDLDSWGANGSFQTENQGPTGLPPDFSINGSFSSLLPVQYRAATDEWLFLI